MTTRGRQSIHFSQKIKEQTKIKYRKIYCMHVLEKVGNYEAIR